jgi:hypothetical protein
MTLGNMRANGVRLAHGVLLAVLGVDKWTDHVTVPSFGQRMVCTQCGIVGPDARPNWAGGRSARP